MQFATYVDPIAQRYASQAMSELFSPLERARTWRRLWIALAESQQELGLSISDAQLEELRGAADQIDLARVAEHEARLRHDVMAHIHAFGEVAPGARGIIHLGATSCFVTDNADLLIIRAGMKIISERLLRMIHALSNFAREHAATPTLGLTHLQPAQLTTVGKRAALWIQDLVDVWESLDGLVERLPFRGAKGTTGTQASFLQLFDGDASKVHALEESLATKMGFPRVVALTGQTYSRSWDYRVLSVLTELAVALHKFSTDLRLAQSWGELEEPYGSSQVGSSAMPYKRNPMKSERLSSLAKLLQGLAPGMANVAATQWMERTLDDSAFRRVGLAQGFLCADSMLIIGRNIAEGVKLQPVVAQRRVMDNLPFLAAEELLMQGVSDGGDRQDLHEKIRQLSWKATEEIRAGRPNPLRSLLEQDAEMAPLLEQLPPWDPQRFVGLAPQQTLSYLDDVVAKLPQPQDDDVSELSV